MIFLPMIFLILAGIASSCMDMNAFHKRNPHNRLMKYYSNKGEKYYQWWIGGNELFPPENPFTADFWHFAKWVYNFCITATILSVIIVSHYQPSIWLALYSFSWLVISGTFVLFYHYVWRDNVEFSRFLKHLFNQGKI